MSRGEVHKLSGLNAKMVLQQSVNLLKLKWISGVVTNPVNKESIALGDPNFIGHTEFYQNAFSVSEVSMCFFSPIFDLVLMSTHYAIKDLPKLVNEANIRRAIEHALELRAVRKIKEPILFIGFNPHAGENGKFGKEDLLIKKLIHEYRDKGAPIEGPYPADSGFVKVAKQENRCVISCYHDQGLVPLKMLSKGKSVNVTWGLPFVRTSIDHGTAFDIANDFKADSGSLGEAVRQAYALSTSGK